MKPESLRRRSCLLLVSAVVVQAALLAGLPSASAQDPAVVDNLDGTKTATWELEDLANLTYSGISVSGGIAELEKVTEGFVDTTEADFLSAEDERNVSVSAPGDVSLAGNAGDLISVGDFSSAGPWTYESSSGGNLTVARDAVGENAYIEHLSGMTDVQFDSMDDIALTGWTSSASMGSVISITQEVANVAEGTGSVNVSFDPVGDPANWGGAARTLLGGDNWSAYNRIVFRADTAYAGGDLVIYVSIRDGVVNEDLPAQTLSTGWSNYSFSLYDFTGDLTSIQEVRILVTNVTAPVFFYVDDIHLTFHKSFDEAGWVNQTFTKPAQTSGRSRGVVLTFDYKVENHTNIALFNASVRVNNTLADFTSFHYFTWTTPWVRNVLDLSTFMTDPGTYQISLSIRVLVDTSDACSALMRFDNVSIIWLDYGDGWLQSQIFDAGSHSVWENISWDEGPQSPAYDITLRTRTGSTSVPDGSWSPWSAPLTNPAGEQITSPSSRYIQYNASLTTTNGSLTPRLLEVRIGGWHYSSAGYIQTQNFVPAEPLVGWRDFNATDSVPPVCGIAYWYWDDTASGWYSVAPGGDLSSLSAQNVTLRANLATTDTTVTPQLFNMSLDYEFLGPIDHIVIDPPIWNGTAEETQDFDATAYDAYGHVLSVTFTWTTTDPNGTIDASGFYTPHDAGTWTITASSGGLWANATVNIAPAGIDRLEITPGSWSGTTDESIDFDCRGYDSKDNEVVIAPAWNTTDPLGIVGVTGTYYPGTANVSGSVWTVYCNDTISSMSASVQVTVTPGALHLVRVSPYSLGTISADDNITFHCYGYDFFGNFIGPADANWSISGSFGTISPERRDYAVFDPILAGSVGNVTCQHDVNLSATTDDFLIVPGALATLQIIPDAVDLKVGQKQQFMAIGFDADGNEVDLVPSSIVWTSNVGSVTQNELKAQTISNEGWMNATVNGVTGSASVRVRALAPPIWDVLLFPWSVLIIVVILAVIIFIWRSIREMYAVEDMFMVGNEGRLIAHRTRRLHADRDEDILAGMLTAIQEFIRDSFREDDELRRFEFGDKEIIIAKGSQIYAAAFFAGKPPKWAESSMTAFVGDFESRYGLDTMKWSGDVTSLEDLDEMMALMVGVKKYREGDWERKLT